MTTSSTSTSNRPNDFGSDLWVRKGTTPSRHPTAGRGLFAGLQDQKHYQVDSGWAKRDNEAPGLFAGLFSRIFGGSYRPPQ
ncbi:hypothetical protein BJX63DRAFT_429426 [Aspergillus granulosus]|uniref:Uncharacterized protein n=1 Tax=Aspergillus granulosus TaxID=176169 RepID=A0ABR4HRJ0_9EURO